MMSAEAAFSRSCSMDASQLRFWLILALCILSAPRSEAKVVESELIIANGNVVFSGETVEALTVNGGIPGPTLEFTEGDLARIHVRNELDVPSSVHWHGLLVPNPQDGVPMVTFPGIPAHSVFTYEFPIRQAGTYWYHSHTGIQEQRGVYGSIVIHPRDTPLHVVDEDYVVVLSDWTDENPDYLMGLLKSENDWFAIERNTNQSVWGALRRGLIGDYLRREWESMPENEISDVSYDRFLIDGGTDRRFAAKPGDTVRLRLINAASATYFYVEFAGGGMSVVAADGQDVVPFETDRLAIAVAETYDVLITVPDEGAYELRATAHDGSGFVNALIGEGERVVAPAVPKPNYYKNVMNSGYLRAMWRTAWDVGGGVELTPPTQAVSEEMPPEAVPVGSGSAHGEGHGSAPAATQHEMKMSLDIPGRPRPPYEKLRAPEESVIPGPRPTRVVTLNLTGDMDRYIWSMNGQTIAPSNTIRIQKGERVRFVLNNRTMMNHPMHLHGHFFRVLNQQGKHAPLKHTIDVAPMQTTVIEFDANEEKDWFFHCHILYHMKGGMERIVHYDGTEADAATLAVRSRLYEDRWYAFGGATVLGNMTSGIAQISNTRNIIEVDWEVAYDDAQYDTTAAYSYYVNRYLSPFLGVNAYREEDSGESVRGVFGFSWLLPLNISSSVWVGTDASFRWTAGKQFYLTRRLVAVANVEYDTVTGWAWEAGSEYILTRHFSLVGQYNSEYGASGGFLVRFFTPGF